MATNKTGISVAKAFDPNEHLRDLKGRGGTQKYLDVKWRIVWLRELHPDAHMVTEMTEHVPGKYAVFKAVVQTFRDQITVTKTTNSDGSVTETTVTERVKAGLSVGWGSETSGDFGDYLEKAETKARGRALAGLGIGTEHVAYFEGDYFEDDAQRLNDQDPGRNKWLGVDSGVEPKDFQIAHGEPTNLTEALRAIAKLGETRGIAAIQKYMMDTWKIESSRSPEFDFEKALATYRFVSKLPEIVPPEAAVA